MTLSPLLPITRAQVLLVGSIIAITFGLLLALGLEFPPADAVAPLTLCSLLAAGAAFYCRRGTTAFVLCLKALAILVGTTAVFGPLTYAVATLHYPWFDAKLAAFDATFGFSAGAVAAWTAGHPLFDLCMRLVYSSVFPQIILVIVVLGFTSDRRLDLFITRFMMAGLLTSAIFLFLPAQGSCAYFHFKTPDHYEPILKELDRLRAGVAIVSWRNGQGIVTFPSFHTIWALLLIDAFRGRRFLFWPIAILNTLVIASCVTTGMHYLADIVGGAIVTAIVVVATRGLLPARDTTPATEVCESCVPAAVGNIPAMSGA